MKDQEGMNALRMSGLIRRVFEPERVAKFNQVIPAVETWEQRLKDYMKATQTKEVHDSLKIFSVSKIVPHEMGKEIIKMPTQKYEVVKTYIFDQCEARKEPWFEGDRGSKAKDYGKDHQGQADMELDLTQALNALEDMKENMCQACGEEGQDDVKEKFDMAMMALKGQYDGGKGKGRFGGTCHHCGKPGHRMSECRLKDAEMKRMRGEKGDTKGGYKGYQGGYQGGGKGYKGKGENQWGKGSWGKGYQGQGQGYPGKGYGATYGKGNGKGQFYWFDGAGDQQGAENWQNVGQGPRQVFNLEKVPLYEPPGLETKNAYGILTSEDDDEEEFDLPESYPSLYEVNEEQRKPEVKKTHMKKVGRKEWRPVQKDYIMTLTAEPVREEMNSLNGASWMHTDPVSKWRRVRSVMDSGASDHCAPPELAPEIPITESVGSKRGQKYTAAGGKTIDNLGQKTVKMMTNECLDVVGTWQTAEVTRPLNSVKKMCEKGNRVWFGAQGGEIHNLYTGEVIPFGIEGDIYTLDLWLPPVEGEGGAQGGNWGSEQLATGFPGPGWRS